MQLIVLKGEVKTLKKTLHLFLILLVIFACNFSAQAAGLSLETGKIDGDTTYVISGPQSGGFKSELIFPIQQQVMELGYQLPLGKYKIESLNFSLLKNIEDESGTFIDSDWLYSYSSEKAIYSESDNYLDFYTVDLAVDFFPLYNSDSGNSYFNLSAGYQKQDFDFDVYNLEQINYLTDRESIVPGKVLTYQIEYSFPYLALNWQKKSKQAQAWNYRISLGFSPFLKAEDRDDHILRDKLSYIEADGEALLAELDLSYNFSSNFAFFAAWDYLSLAADGTQTQKNYSGTVLFENIDAEISSKQSLFSAGMSYKF